MDYQLFYIQYHTLMTLILHYYTYSLCLYYPIPHLLTVTILQYLNDHILQQYARQSYHTIIRKLTMHMFICNTYVCMYMCMYVHVYDTCYIGLYHSVIAIILSVIIAVKLLHYLHMYIRICMYIIMYMYVYGNL